MEQKRLPEHESTINTHVQGKTSWPHADDYENLSDATGNEIDYVSTELLIRDLKRKKIMLELDLNYFNFLNQLEVDCQSSSDSKGKI